VGVERAAGPGGQPAVRPALEPLQLAATQLVLRGEVAVVRAQDEGVRRLGVQAARNRLGWLQIGHFREPTDGQFERAYHTLLDRRRRQVLHSEVITTQSRFANMPSRLLVSAFADVVKDAGQFRRDHGWRASVQSF
jgi:hypothetical protein